MKVLVTGATGFTGKNLSKHLLDRKENVVVLVRDKSKLGNLLNYNNLEVIEGNIFEKDVVEKSMNGVEKVFNIAAIYRTSGIPDQVYWDTHVKGTELLLEAALKQGVKKFVHTSTVGVHGDVGTSAPANENSPFQPGDIYQITKLEGEKLVHKFYAEKGLPIVVIRPTAIYGPGDLRLLKLFKIASHKISFILGDGKIKYHMVYIDDLVQGFILASEVNEAIGKEFIIGGDDAKSLNEILDNIGIAINKKIIKFYLPAKPFQILGTVAEKLFIPLGINPPIYRRRVDFFTKSRSFDISKAKNFLSYSPKISLEMGIQLTAKWYIDNGYLR